MDSSRILKYNTIVLGSTRFEFRLRVKVSHITLNFKFEFNRQIWKTVFWNVVFRGLELLVLSNSESSILNLYFWIDYHSWETRISPGKDESSWTFISPVRLCINFGGVTTQRSPLCTFLVGGRGHQHCYDKVWHYYCEKDTNNFEWESREAAVELENIDFLSGQNDDDFMDDVFSLALHRKTIKLLAHPTDFPTIDFPLDAGEESENEAIRAKR